MSSPSRVARDLYSLSRKIVDLPSKQCHQLRLELDMLAKISGVTCQCYARCTKIASILVLSYIGGCDGFEAAKLEPSMAQLMMDGLVDFRQL